MTHFACNWRLNFSGTIVKVTEYPSRRYYQYHMASPSLSANMSWLFSLLGDDAFSSHKFFLKFVFEFKHFCHNISLLKHSKATIFQRSTTRLQNLAGRKVVQLTKSGKLENLALDGTFAYHPRTGLFNRRQYKYHWDGTFDNTEDDNVNWNEKVEFTITADSWQ